MPTILAAMGVEIVEPVVGVVEERPKSAEGIAGAALADREQLGFRAIDRFLNVRPSS